MSELTTRPAISFYITVELVMNSVVSILEITADGNSGDEPVLTNWGEKS